jgi:hypothetical protein
LRLIEDYVNLRKEMTPLEYNTIRKALDTINTDYVDEHGLIVHWNKHGQKDGGDTLNRVGIEGSINAMTTELYGRCGSAEQETIRQDRNRLAIRLNTLMIAPGTWIRHPERSPDWDLPEVRDFAKWNDPSVCSRDQVLPAIISAGWHGMTGFVSETWKNIKENYYRFQNGDLCDPESIGAVLRALNHPTKAFYLIDLYSTLATILTLLKACVKPLDTSDDLARFLLLTQAYFHQPTPIARFNLWLYLNCRRLGVGQAWKTYFHRAGDPPFDEAVEVLVEVLRRRA